MRDILPEDQKYLRYILKKSDQLLDYYGFERIYTPIVESVDLFLRSVGETSDIMEKEIYTFKTKGGDILALRPEGTAGMIRAYIENGMNVRPHPVKLSYWGPMFRHDQPQRGRYRQFYQLGAETIGDSSEAVDAELIFLGYKLLDMIGLDNYNVHVNSLGDSSCRPAYLKALKDYYKNRSKKLCSNCKNRLKTNILRLLDCKEAECVELTKEAPQIVDFLDEDCRKHFKHVLEFLDEARVPYILNPRLVRGLDYYTRTVFEFLPDEDPSNPSGQEAQLAIIAGGRYDKLAEMLGGSKTPAAGWAMGLDRVVMAIKEKNVNVPDSVPRPKVFLVQLGEAAKRKSLNLYESFRKAGIEAKSSIGRDSIKSQLRIANRLGVRFALIFGQKEALDGTIILREMDTGVQETIPLEKIVDEVKKRLRA
ncbi:MAG: histidine--tRNA ligase [Candidatus Yanofskybacteria bacterium RIFCSPHIGHO2_02_FULL_43_22]|uniref:Histidine--tRNA ligase n=1 Tax=Candidatus Yanofskybacteria bacterium RIFCSPHIGHO2_02_FULL_43_22 TaxID=1802681 RepID=A0A1F8FP95_9BACT|nr:MAG: histidine--tRNA ligase [Candidatus Yanofskybacteria bacterium RIFCSPHIGHO2_02_FULL_43_22]